MTHTARWTALGIASALAAVVAACQVLVGADDEKGSAPPAAASSAAPTTPPGADPCPHKVPPRATEGADGADLPPIAFAVTQLTGLPRPDARPFGLDLDGLCTGLYGDLDGGAPCKRFVTDEPGGVDNAGARLFQALPDDRGALIFQGFARGVREGTRTMLLVLSRYSGAADDPLVQVRIAPSEGLEAAVCDAGRQADAAPESDGCDRWAYSDPALPSAAGGPRPTEPLDGYVSGGQLVVGARKAAAIDLTLGDLPLSVGAAYLVATLGEKRPGVRSLDGVLAGRIAPAALMSGLSRDTATCATGLPALKATVCEYRDIPATPEEDRTSGAKACASISVGLRFQAVQAKLGGQVQETPLAPPCGATLPTCD